MIDRTRLGFIRQVASAVIALLFTVSLVLAIVSGRVSDFAALMFAILLVVMLWDYARMAREALRRGQ